MSNFVRFTPARIGLIALAAILLALPVLAQDTARLRLRNSARQAILEVYAALPGTDRWGDDLLGSDVLAPGRSITVRPGVAGCLADIRVVFENGARDLRREVNLCQGQELAFADPAGGGAVGGGTARGLGAPTGAAPGMAAPAVGASRGLPPTTAAPPPPAPPTEGTRGLRPQPAPAVAYRPTPAPPPTPVYNLLLDGPSGAQAQVQRGRETTATFYVGPPSEENRAVDADTGQVAQPRFNTRRDTSLMVHFECGWCQGEKLQSRRVTYVASNRASDRAEFKFTAAADARSAPDAPLQLHVYVTGGGESFRHLRVPVQLVDTAGPVAAGPPRNLAQSGGRAAPAAAEGDSTQDVLLTILPDNTGFRLSALFSDRFMEAANPNDRLVLEQARAAPQPLPLGISDTSALKGIGDQVYSTLRALGMGDADVAGAPVMNARNTPFLSEEDFPKALQSMCDLGNQLYARLFFDSGSDRLLRQLLPVIERTGRNGGPFVLHVQTRNLFLPWQLLHPGGCRNAGAEANFWGLVWNISSQPLEPERAGGSLPATANTSAGRAVMFGRYDDPASTSPAAVQVRQAALRMNQTLAGLVGTQATVATTGPVFLNRLEQNREATTLIWTYTHADSGRRGAANASQRLIFADGNDRFNVLPDNLDELYRRLGLPQMMSGSDETVVFTRRPLVVLLGCETGATPESPFSSRSLGGLFLKLGASGVLVTETPVWAEATVEFGSKLAERITRGTAVPAALREMRAEWMARRNPYGLVFTFYGHPEAKL